VLNCVYSASGFEMEVEVLTCPS